MAKRCRSCCTATPIGQVCGTVTGCTTSIAVPGCAVRLLTSANVVISSTTSDGSGAYCLPYYVAGSYKVQADPPTSPVGYAQGTAALNSYTSGTTSGRNVALAVDALYRCVSCCSYPIKKTLVLATPAGNLSAVNNPGGTNTNLWSVTTTFSGTTLICDALGNEVSTGAGNYDVTFELECLPGSGNQWRFRAVFQGRFTTIGGAAQCAASRAVFGDNTNATVCGGNWSANYTAALQACSASPYDMIFAIPATVTVVCPNNFASNVTVALPFNGSYEYTF